MRTGDLARRHPHAKLGSNSLFLTLVAVPIAASVILAWQVSSRMVARENAARPSVAVHRTEETRSSESTLAESKAPQTSTILEENFTGSIPGNRLMPFGAHSTAEVHEPVPQDSSNSTLSQVPDGPTSNEPLLSVAPTPLIDPPHPPASEIAVQEPLESADLPKSSDLVDLNSASLQQLNNLGAGRIGRAIIRGRPYLSKEDLVRKRVLNRTDFGRIKDQVTVGTAIAVE
jgi:DNA uptake protein ComE-like DNA-binding protein